MHIKVILSLKREQPQHQKHRTLVSVEKEHQGGTKMAMPWEDPSLASPLEHS